MVILEGSHGSNSIFASFVTATSLVCVAYYMQFSIEDVGGQLGDTELLDAAIFGIFELNGLLIEPAMKRPLAGGRADDEASA